MRKTMCGFGAVTALIAVQMGASAQGQFVVPDYPQMVKKAITKSLPLLQSSAATFTKTTTCISCHHQSLPSMTMALAREHGFTVDEKLAKEQTQTVYDFLAHGKGLFEQAQTKPAAEKMLDTMTVDPSISVGYLLGGLAAEKWKADEVTGLTALYLARKQTEEGYWPLLEARQPFESSEFATTALAVRSLQTYAPKDHADAIAKQIERARAWLIATPPKTTEDNAFRLFGLRWAGGSEAEIRKATEALLAQQNDDGGWSQAAGIGSDAYATGQALVALNQGGNLPITHSAYHRGYKYLLKTQREDGSWFVAKRTIGLQRYFESGFPHKESQFISICGTCWATMALTLTVEPPKATAQIPVPLESPSPRRTQ